MSRDIIPDDVARFLLEKIDSVAHMEALLLLRSSPAQGWSVDAVAKRLYINDQQSAELLTRLSRDGLVIETMGDFPEYQYRQGAPEMENLINRVVEIYSKHLVPVTNLIHAKPKTRVQEFADAFKLRKEE